MLADNLQTVLHFSFNKLIFLNRVLTRGAKKESYALILSIFIVKLPTQSQLKVAEPKMGLTWKWPSSTTSQTHVGNISVVYWPALDLTLFPGFRKSCMIFVQATMWSTPNFWSNIILNVVVVVTIVAVVELIVLVLNILFICGKKKCSTSIPWTYCFFLLKRDLR